jgi:hypothetical protein
VGKKAAQRLGVFGPLLTRRTGVSVRNGVLLYKQLKSQRPLAKAIPILLGSNRRKPSNQNPFYKGHVA